MSERKMDQRKVRTRKKLKDSFLDELQKREYKDISVREFTKKAGLTFKTFYRHYATMDEFAASLLQEEFMNVNQNLKPGMNKKILIENGELIFDNVNNKPHIYQLLKYGQIESLIIPDLKYWTYIGAKEEIERYTTNSEITDIVVNHIVSSVLSLLKWRVDNPDKLSIKEMAVIFSDLVINSTISFLINISV